MKKGGLGIIWALAFEVTPAAIFGGAVGFSVATLLRSPWLEVAPAAASAGAFGCAWLLLKRLGKPARRLYVPEFDLGALEPEVTDFPPLVETALDDELVLDEEVQLEVEEEELVLEEPLPAYDEASRVVQLFRREEQPTAGELQERIDRHLRTTPRTMPEATQELDAALAELRRSLR